jgi:hypothetical protein
LFPAQRIWGFQLFVVLFGGHALNKAAFVGYGSSA